MTDAPLTPDAADELASAYLDGEATAGERARVERDPELLERVGALARARAAVEAAPVPVDPIRREAALQAALDAAAEPGGVLAGAADDGRPATVVPLARRTTPAPRWRYLAVAAAVALAVLAVPLLSQLGDGDDDADTASVALDDESRAEGDGEGLDATEQEEATPMVEDAAGGASSAPAFDAGELGAFEDLEALVAAARERTTADAPTATTTAATGAEGVTSTTVAGPCSGQLELPADVEVLLDGTATLEGQPVVVIVHRAPGGDPQLLVALVEGCRTLVDQPL